jgi:hypothetical protein
MNLGALHALCCLSQQNHEALAALDACLNGQPVNREMCR